MFDLGATVGPARPLDVPPVPAHRLSVSNVNENEPANVPRLVVGPTATLPATVSTASEIPSVPGPPISVHDVDTNNPPRLSSYGVNPTAAYENKSNWKSTLYAGAKLAIDVVKEASDACTPLKSVAGGLSAVLKYCDVRHSRCLSICLLTLVSKSANDGEPQDGRILGATHRRPRGIVEGACSRRRGQRDREKREAHTVIYYLSGSMFRANIIFFSKLRDAAQELKTLEDQGKVAGFLNNATDAEALTGLAEDVRNAMMDYQVCTIAMFD